MEVLSFASEPSKFYFPPELVEVVVAEAWLTCPDSGARWRLFDSLRCVNMMWGDVALLIALRHIILESPLDVRRYRAISLGYNKPPWLLTNNPEGCFQGPRILRSHLRFVMRDEYQRDTFLTWSEYFTGFHIFSQHYVSAEILITESGIQPDKDKWDALFVFLSQLRSLRSLYLVWPEPSSSKVDAYLPKIAIPSVTHLCLSRFERCFCSPWERDICLTRNIMRRFPNVRHLHLEASCKFFLKTLLPCPSLQQLTLDLPPTRSILGREPFSSVMEFNISAALNRGLLQRRKPGSAQRRIVVNTGLEEPLGWKQAQATCDAHGVQLERHSVYLC